MGILTNLVELKSKQDNQLLTGAIQGFEKIITDPNVTPQAKEYYQHSLLNLVDQHFDSTNPGGGGKKGGVSKIFSGLLSAVSGGMSNVVSRENQRGQAIRGELGRASAGAPQKLFYTPEEQVAQKGQEQAQQAKQQNTQQLINMRDRLATLKQNAELFGGETTPDYLAARKQIIANATGVKSAELPSYLEDRRTPLRPANTRVVTMADESGKITGTLEFDPQTRKFYDTGGEVDASGLHFATKAELTPPKGPAGQIKQVIDAEKIVADPKAPVPEKKAAQEFIAKYNRLPGKAGATAAGAGSGPGGGGALGGVSRTLGAGAPGTAGSANLNEFLGRTLGMIPAARDRGTALRVREGLEEFKKLTGMTTEQVYAAVTAKKADAKALNESVTRYRAYEGLEKRLVAHGEILKDARRKLPDLKLKRLNALVQTGQLETNDPELNKYLVAINAVSREYATAISNGFQSRAMLPVHSSEEAAKILAPSLSTGAVDGIVDQLKVEVSAGEKALKEQQREIAKDLGTSIGDFGKSQPSGETREYNGHSYHRDKAGDSWKLVK